MGTANDVALTKLLDQVDRMRMRQRIAFIAVSLALAGMMLWISSVSKRPGTDFKELIVWSVIATVFSVVYGAMALAIYINGQVRRILKAIEMVKQ